MSRLTNDLKTLIRRTERLARKEGACYADSFLWDVLTALRGPDTWAPGASGLKGDTTARIRAFALPNVAKSVFTPAAFSTASGRFLASSLNGKSQLGEGALFSTSHFGSHVRDAINALKTLGYRVPEIIE